MLNRFTIEVEAVQAEVFQGDDLNTAANHIKSLCDEIGTHILPIGMSNNPLTNKLRVALSMLGIETPGNPDECEICMSVADFGIAETGTLVFLENSADETRIGTLPKTHIAIIRAADIHQTSSDIGGEIEDHLSNPGYRRVSFITGPSRTADIERELTTGVHGPGRLVIVIMESHTKVCATHSENITSD